MTAKLGFNRFLSAAVATLALTATVAWAAGDATSSAPPSAKPAADMGRFLTELASGWQTGKDTSHLASAYILDVVKVQTKGKGYYQDLADLGPVTGARVLSQQQLPKGTLYAMAATHEHGGSAWLIGIDAKTGMATYVAIPEMSKAPQLTEAAHPACLMGAGDLC